MLTLKPSPTPPLTALPPPPPPHTIMFCLRAPATTATAPNDLDRTASDTETRRGVSSGRGGGEKELMASSSEGPEYLGAREGEERRGEGRQKDGEEGRGEECVRERGGGGALKVLSETCSTFHRLCKSISTLVTSPHQAASGQSPAGAASRFTPSSPLMASHRTEPSRKPHCRVRNGASTAFTPSNTALS